MRNLSNSKKSVPGATYRLQLNSQFQFKDAEALLPYLKELGVTHAYLSPILKSGSASTHGYDVCCPNEIDPKLGGLEGFESFTRELARQGLGLLLDIVPNHMRADPENPWWFDVLERGADSPYASYFDFHWLTGKDVRPTGREHTPRNRVLVPMLEDAYANVLEAGKIKLVYEKGRFWVAYYEHRFPASLPTYLTVLAELITDVPNKTVAKAAHKLLCCSDLDEIKTQFEEFHDLETVPMHLKACLDRLNGKAGKPESFDKLNAILTRQHFRLCSWKIANEEINYRRFFEVNELVCLNVQEAQVFQASHKLIRSLVRGQTPIGLRVDHPDGLWDPERYLRRLKGLFPSRSPAPFVVVEKILTDNEALPETWPVAGTTGYDFLVQMNGIFVDQSQEPAFTRIYQEFSGQNNDFAQTLFECRHTELLSGFVVPLKSLAQQLNDLAARTRYARDLTASTLETALENFISAFPIYRTYLSPRDPAPTMQDAEAIREAARQSLKRAPHASAAATEFIVQLLTFQLPRDFDANARKQSIAFAMKLQQLTSPLAAKGGEDTALYVYNRLTSLCEVGGNPGIFGRSVDEFHKANLKRAKTWPHSQLATSTHDTKRSEDVRARINVLSELPEEWENQLLKWSQLNKFAETTVNHGPCPTRNDLYLLYQSLLGAWPAEPEPDMATFTARLTDYMLKAIREAKTNTHWNNPNPEYESGMIEYVKTILAEPQNNPFLADFKPFQQKVAYFGYLNSLSQVLIKTVSPGVPDFYRGTENLELSLVDPDNRRAVDYKHLQELFSVLKRRVNELPRHELLQDLLIKVPFDGSLKLFVTWEGLQARAEYEDLFKNGDYIPLQSTEKGKQHLCAIMRTHNEQKLIALAPRLPVGLTNGQGCMPIGMKAWGKSLLFCPDTSPGEHFHERFSDLHLLAKEMDGQAVLEIGEILSTFPLALLETVN